MANATPAKSFFSKIDYGLSYLGKSNLAQDQEVKSSSHAVGFSASYPFAESIQLSMYSGLSSVAVGSNVTKKEGNPAWQDLDLGASISTEISSSTKLSAGLINSFPTGYESQREEIKSISSAQIHLSTDFFNSRLNIGNFLKTSYIFNTNEVSPNSLEINPEYTGLYSLGAVFKLHRNWSLGAKASAETVHFINSYDDLKTNTVQFVQFREKKWKATLSHLIGTYDENDHVRLLYQDFTKQVVSLGVEIEFN